MPKKPETKICAIVVAYNRKDLLRGCLTALQNQTRKLDRILVVDNASMDGTGDMLRTEFPGISVMTLESNTGGAGGFHFGMKKAYDEGYELFWLMDDDAEPQDDALEILLSTNEWKFDDVVCIAGRVVDRDGNIALSHRGYFNDFDEILFNPTHRNVSEAGYKNALIEIDMISFVGPLIKRSAVDKIGLPMKEFFIHGDDFEYSIRLRIKGRIILNTSSIIKHYEAAIRTDGPKTRNSSFVEYEKLWIRYYGKRNLLYIAKRQYKNFFRFLIALMRLCRQEVKISIYTLLYSDMKVKRVILPYLAIINGLRNDFDNTVPRRWLYNKD